jgi:Tfp pilus assembly protein PilW
MNAASVPSRRRSRTAGFTLAELLLASVLGAMLLSGLAMTTFSFAKNLDHLEEKAGISGADADPVLRRITRDIREAWYVEKLGSTHLKIAATDGALTEYYTEGTNLLVKRPNGDTGVIYANFTSIMMEAATTDRFREGDSASHDGVWYSVDAPASPDGTLVATSNQQISIAFVAPSTPSGIPGAGSATEQVLSVQSSIVTLPLAWNVGTGTNQLQVSLYESWAPGLARPTSAPLATLQLNGASMPAATQTAGVWNVPAGTVAVSLPATLEPGVGYTLVLMPLGSTNTVVVKRKAVAAFQQDQVMHKGTGSAPWIQQLALVPFTISGPWQETTTAVEQIITRVTITIIPKNRPLQQRSASVLSQALTDDPWMGVVPGDEAP